MKKDTNPKSSAIPIMDFREYELKDKLQRHLSQEAASLMGEGDLKGALSKLKLEENLCRQLGRKRELALCLCMQTEIFQEQGRLDDAVSMLQEVEQIGRELKIDGYIEGSLNGRVKILLKRRRFKEALVVLRQQEEFCRKLENKERLIACLATQGIVLAEHLGDPKTGLAVAEEAYELAKKHGMNSHYEQIQQILEYARSHLA